MDKKLNIIQPNPLTAARYSYNVYEKRIMYHLIAQLQREMRGEIELQKSIFNDRYFKIPYRLIDADLKNYRKVRESLESMRLKSIQIKRRENSWFGGGLINWYDLEDGIITISLPPPIAPALLDISEGFTAFGAMVASTLQSVYSMRWYEWCCQFKDTGKWYTTPDEIRERLGLQDHKSYLNYANLKAKVIDVAQKELHELYANNLSDVAFSVKETRSGRGQGGSVTRLAITIYWKKKNEVVDENQNEDYLVVAHFLSQYFKSETKDTKIYKNTVLQRISSENRVEQAAKLVLIAKQKNDPAAYFRVALQDQAGINSKVAKLTQEEKEAEQKTVKRAKSGRSGETNIGAVISAKLPIGGIGDTAENIYEKAKKKANKPLSKLFNKETSED